MVPVSAAAALRMMRSQNQDRVLWIIAICINQKDLAERAQQVQMMSLIYSRSTGNLIYLGEGDGSMRSALKSLQNVYHDLEQETDDFTQLDGTLFKTGTDPVREETKLTCGVDIPALKTLFSLPWFRRLWIFQEVVLAPCNTCYIGPFDFSFLLLVRAAMWLFGNKKVDHELIQSLYKSNCVLVFHFVDRSFGACVMGVTPRMENLLFGALYFLASEQGDFVYGMLGIHQNVQQGPLHRLLVPDFTKPAADVFRDATRYLIEVRDCIRTWLWIYWETEDELQSSEIPSWAIDWSRLRANKSRDLHLRRFNAGCEGPRSRSIAFSTDDANLVLVEGIRLAEVVDTTSVLTDAMLIDAEIGKQCPWLEDCISKVYEHLPTEEVEEALSSVLTAFDNGRYLPTEQRSQAMAEFISSLGLARNPSIRSPMSSDQAELAGLALHFFRAWTYTCSNRRIFTTTGGHLGIESIVLEEGDVIAVLSGFHAPYILRPFGPDYRIVGACYGSSCKAKQLSSIAPMGSLTQYSD